MKIIYIVFVFNYLICLLCIYRILTSNREPIGAVIWIFLILILPFLGPLIYLFFGFFQYKRRISRHKKSKHLIRQYLNNIWSEKNKNIKHSYAKIKKFHTILDSLTQFPPIPGNKINLLVNGDQAYPEMLKEIENAESTINIQSYIIADDNIGHDFVNSLVKKAEQGIKIKILYDAIGSFYTNNNFFRKLKRKNIQIYAYNRISILKRKFQLNTRNHRKNLIIDGKVAFSGGMNIHNENYSKYCKDINNQYRDYHFKIQGPVVTYFQSIFMQDWHYVTKQIKNNIHYFPILDECGDAMIRIIDSGPSSNFKVFSCAISAAINSAEKSVTVISPYFMPEPEILGTIKTAALAGIKIKIIIPEINDHKFIQYAMESLYPDLLEYHIEIYKRKPPFIHSKLILIDNDRVILGSANLDYRSSRLNYELCFEVIDNNLINDLIKIVRYEKEQSAKLELNKYRNLNPIIQMRNNFCALFAPIL